ncbi:MAG: LamG domain-containing protein, partial [Planctomycetota bacterium]
MAQYAFENDANDSSANGIHGSIVGDPNFVEGLPDYGMALDLDGIDDLVELGKFDVFGQITLAAWIKPDDFEINDARIISKANEWGGNDHWWMVSTISETSLRFRLKTDDGQSTATLISDSVLEAGAWAHVAATWDGSTMRIYKDGVGSTMRIYKDGVEVASQAKGGSAVAVDPSVSVAIGSQPSDAFASDPGHVAKFFDGLIDEVGIYHRALSTGEILYLAGERAQDPSLVAWWKLDDNADDSSGNGHSGTIEGAPSWVSPGWDGAGACMRFGGDSDRITVNSFDVTGSGITLAAWINPITLMDDARMVSKSQGSGTADHYWAMILSGSGEDDLQFRLRTDVGSTTRYTVAGGNEVQANEWTHVAV